MSLAKPHEGDPSVVFASDPLPWVSRLRPGSHGGTWKGVPLAHFLAEPGGRQNTWLPMVTSRLLIASAGPLLVAAEGPGATRLELARWPRVSPDLDTVQLEEARRAYWPVLPELREKALGLGSLAPDLVLVGERDPYDRVPFFARSGVWLFQALRMLGYDELSCYVTNALDYKKHSRSRELAWLRDAFARYEPTFVALGGAAEEVLKAAEVKYVRAPHPAPHRRFKFTSGPEGYMAEMREGGLEPGPWFEKVLPVLAPDPENTLPVSYGLPLSVAFKATETKRRDNIQRIDGALAARARTMFVLGEAATVGEAGKRVGIVSQSARQALKIQARTDDWFAEREAHLLQKREKAKAETVNLEAKAIVQARKMSWSALTLALAGFLKQLKDPNTRVRAQDVKAIGDFTLALAEKGDIKLDAEKERLGQLNPIEILKEMKAATVGIFGELPVEPEEEKK